MEHLYCPWHQAETCMLVGQTQVLVCAISGLSISLEHSSCPLWTIQAPATVRLRCNRAYSLPWTLHIIHPLTSGSIAVAKPVFTDGVLEQPQHQTETRAL
jgi:hypothetical protein